MATNDMEDPIDLNDDELDALQRAEDGEDPSTDPKVDEDATGTDAAAADKAAGAADPAQTDPNPKDDPAAQAAATDKPAADKPAGGEGGKVEGVASKDGTRVLPYAALQAERRSARAASSRADRAERDLAAAQQLIADLKAGKNPDGDRLTEEQVADMEANFPDEGKKLRAAFNRIQDLETKIPKAAPDKDEPGDDPVQEAIDQVPLLLEWQHQDGEKFSRAVEHDALLMKSPKWQGKPALERFTEAARRTAEEFDIPFETKPSTKTPPAAKAAPATAAQEPARKSPETLSDFKGGAIPDHGTTDWNRLSAKSQLNRMEGMTDDEIDAHLAKYG